MIQPSNEFLKVFKETSGALSVCESIAIMNIAALAPQGTYVELGTYHGKSAMSAMVSLRDGQFNLVDPIFNDKKLGNDICKSVDVLGLASPVFFGELSTDFIPRQLYTYSYVFVDSGSHQDGLPMEEVRLLEDRVVPNGIIAFHDYESQFKEVKEAYDYLVLTGKYEPIYINWSEIINYVREHNLESNNNSWHHLELDFPCFVGAVKRK